MIEKAQDSCSEGALAQADIEAYYSHIPLSIPGRHLLRQQCGLAWAGAALRAHACPTVYLGEIRYLVPPKHHEAYENDGGNQHGEHDGR